MSTEFENQIKESVFHDNLAQFYKRYKKYIILFLIIIVLGPLIYSSYIFYNKKINEQNFNKYTQAINYADNKNFTKSREILINLLEHSNDTLALLSFNKLLEMNKLLEISIDEIFLKVSKKKRSKEFDDIIAIKKTLFFFDTIEESKILELLNIKDNKSNYNLVKLQILRDFYLSKMEYNKATDIDKKLNEN